jgi:putative peptidoglycan lipid II flippase
MSVLFVSVFKLGVWSIALAYSITSIMDLVVLLYLLSKAVGGFDWLSIIKPFTKIAYATLFMGLMLYVPMKLLDNFIFDTSRTINLLLLCVVTGVVGAGAYLWLTQAMHVSEIELFYKVMVKLNLRKLPKPVPQPLEQMETSV